MPFIHLNVKATSHIIYQSWYVNPPILLSNISQCMIALFKMFDFSFLSLPHHSCLSACFAATVCMRRISSVCGWGRRVTPACRCSSPSFTSLRPWSAVYSTRSSTQVRFSSLNYQSALHCSAFMCKWWNDFFCLLAAVAAVIKYSITGILATINILLY